MWVDGYICQRNVRGWCQSYGGWLLGSGVMVVGVLCCHSLYGVYVKAGGVTGIYDG